MLGTTICFCRREAMRLVGRHAVIIRLFICRVCARWVCGLFMVLVVLVSKTKEGVGPDVQPALIDLYICNVGFYGLRIKAGRRY